MRGAVVLYGIIVILVYMQDEDENEESKGFVGGICERIRNWEFRHPWIARPFWYFILWYLFCLFATGHSITSIFTTPTPTAPDTCSAQWFRRRRQSLLSS
jgi:uncharacterized membrane protein (DUF106 family)